jgi:glycine/D-amino acid oxidase-like deaminating enzyme
LASYDLVVVGGGVQGLWIGRQARARGLSVVVVDKVAAGAGASGGIVGALMAHMPLPWGAKKQFQLEALVELEGLAGEIAAVTGLDPGYARVGRIMAIRSKRYRRVAIERAAATIETWRHEAGRFRMDVVPGDAFADWLAPEEAPEGILVDSLAARVEPGKFVAALKAALIAEGGQVLEGWDFETFDERRGAAVGSGGAEINAGRVVLAAGYQTFEMAGRLAGLDLGGGVKGQAALLSARMPQHRPIIYDDGLYIVAHTRETCAIGSTTEPEWSDPGATDEAIEGRIKRARQICPALSEAKVIRRWAGVRPKAWARDPIVGPLNEGGRLWIASGGFKITFGIAHSIARACLDWMLEGRAPDGLPGSFHVGAHIEAARAREGRAERDNAGRR